MGIWSDGQMVRLVRGRGNIDISIWSNLPVDVAFFLGGALKFHNFGNCEAFGIVGGSTVVVPLCRSLSIIVSLGVMLGEYSSVYLLIWCAHVGIISMHMFQSHRSKDLNCCHLFQHMYFNWLCSVKLRNAYIQIAINGHNFCTAAKKADVFCLPQLSVTDYDDHPNEKPLMFKAFLLPGEFCFQDQNSWKSSQSSSEFPKLVEEVSRWGLVVPPRVAFGFAWHCR